MKCGVEEGLRRRDFGLPILSELRWETAVVVERAVVVDWLSRFVMVLPGATGVVVETGTESLQAACWEINLWAGMDG